MRTLGIFLGLTKSASASKWHADTAGYLARVAANGGAVTFTQTVAVDSLIRYLAANGLRSSIKRLNPMVGDALAMVVPIYNDWGNVKDTLGGSPTVTARGLGPNSSAQYLDTSVNPNTAPGWDTNNSSMGCFTVEGNTTGANVGIMGCYYSGGTQRWALKWDTSSILYGYFGLTAENLARNSRPLGVGGGFVSMSSVAGVTSLYQDGLSVIASGTTSSATKPIASIMVGNINGGGAAGNHVTGGYYVGTAMSAANMNLMATAFHLLAQLAGRQENWIPVGDSLTSGGLWVSTLQANTLPRRTFTIVATGGVGTATMLANITDAIAAQPCLKWMNVHIWAGQNDSKVGGWDGSNTIANVSAMLALFPHQSFRVAKMIYQQAVAEYIGGAIRTVKDYVSNTWATMYGAKALGYPAALVNSGNYSNAQDVRDTTNGVIPSTIKKTLVTPAISVITQANHAVLTVASTTTILTGDVCTFSGVVGMTQINGLYSRVTIIDGTHLSCDFIDSTAFTAYSSAGVCTQVDSTHINATGDQVVAKMLGDSILGLVDPVGDAIPLTSCLYSLRRLRSTYTGPLVNVRRASDNATLDIGFIQTAFGATGIDGLDIAALQTFCAGTDGFVTKWYDQSSAGNHASQLTAANQPKIATAGVAISSGGTPCLDASWNITSLLTAVASSTLPDAGDASSAVVHVPSSNAGGGYGRIWERDANAFLLWTSGTLQAYVSTSLATAGAAPTGIKTVSSITRVGGTNGISYFANGSPWGITTSTAVVTTTVLNLLNRGDLTRGHNGQVQEIIITRQTWTTAQRQIVEHNQGAYYGITVP